MENNEISLMILGEASNDVIRALKKSFAGRQKEPNSIVLFCDYSTNTIPLGYTFKQIKKDGNTIFSGSIRLNLVTQQIDRPIDEISTGWKTICEFIFPEGVPEELRSAVRVIDTWDYNGRSKIEFCGNAVDVV